MKQISQQESAGNGKINQDQLKKELWESVRNRKVLPIGHPIPKLRPRQHSGAVSRLAQIEAFVQERIRTGAARLTALTLVASAGTALLCSGCTSVSYCSASGERFTRTAFGTASAINALDLESGTNGLRTIHLKGFSSDSANTLGVVTEAAVRAALTGK